MSGGYLSGEYLSGGICPRIPHNNALFNINFYSTLVYYAIAKSLNYTLSE